MDLLLNKIYEGSALNVLNELPENSVNMCVTSPPYWGLRDYETNPAKWNDGWSGELGAEAAAKDISNIYGKRGVSADSIMEKVIFFAQKRFPCGSRLNIII